MPNIDDLPPTDNPISTAQTYGIEEYKSLRAEILAETARVESLSKFVLSAAAAIYTWLATHIPPSHVDVIYRVAWLIPIGGALFGWLLSDVTRERIQAMGDYLKKYESAFLGRDGWEHFLELKKEGTTDAIQFFWGLLTFSFVIVGVIAMIAIPQTPEVSKCPEKLTSIGKAECN